MALCVQRLVLRCFRHHNQLEGEVTEHMPTWQGTGGFSIDACVRIEGTDRHGLEHLSRYCARPPFALKRLHTPDDQSSLRPAVGVYSSFTFRSRRVRADAQVFLSHLDEGRTPLDHKPSAPRTAAR